MRRILVAFALLACACSLFALGFRRTTWLMSKDEVVASEEGPIVSELNLPGQQQVVYHTVVYGHPATLTYLLENDKLLSASYTFFRDLKREAFLAMKKGLLATNGPPAFEQENLAGWRLPKTEIALAHLSDGTTYVAYWEKSYFARLNHLPPPGP
jgi:hypothetical protein